MVACFHTVEQFMTIYYSGFQPGVPGPLGVRNNIFGGPKCHFRGWEFVCYCWIYFFQNDQDLWISQVLLLKI